MKKVSTSVAITAALSAVALVGTAPTAYASPAHSPGAICGPGSVVDKHALGSPRDADAAIIYLIYDARTGRNCVTVIRQNPNPRKEVHMHVQVRVSGGSWVQKDGQHASYMGPVMVPAAGKCVQWGGGSNRLSWMSGFGHCG
ncbi:acetyltransferase [Streptomyces venezuelae]|uniref:acetyltransferase n=1 Tax=Streptomyces venezuelae TaxID=54571 RepID=UPI001239593D|nr:acetyltransferase [Streptomyces venezuelae]